MDKLALSLPGTSSGIQKQSANQVARTMSRHGDMAMAES
jgi:hypothetical protein